MFFLPILSSNQNGFKANEGFLVPILETEQWQGRSNTQGVDTPGGPVTSPAGASHTGNLYGTRAPSLFFQEKKGDFIAAGDSCDGGWLAARGRGFPPHLLLQDLVAQQTVEFGDFHLVSSAPSYHCRQMALIKLLCFRFLQSSAHQRNPRACWCSRALKSPAQGGTSQVSPGAEAAQNMSPPVQTPGQQKTLTPGSLGLEPTLFSPWHSSGISSWSSNT